MISFAHGSYALRNCYCITVYGYMCSGNDNGIYQVYHNNFGEPGGNPLNAFGFGNSGLQGGFCNEIYGYFYSNNRAFYGCLKNIHRGGSVGYNSRGTVSANSTDFHVTDPHAPNAILINTKTGNPPSISSRNSTNYPGWIKFEQYQQTANAHYILDMAGDVIKIPADGSGYNPTQRSGGNADVLEVTPQSNCSAIFYLELLRVRLWAAAGVSKTYRFYLQTSFATLAKTVLVLYGEYLDQGSGGHLGTTNSSASGNFTTITPPSGDWGQYVEVAINPAQDGYVTLYLRLMGYESGKKVWIDPKIAITGGDTVTVTPRWSYGEVQLDIDPVATGGGGSSPPANSGLLPLGVMEVVV
jgi:hypothetical protein